MEMEKGLLSHFTTTAPRGPIPVVLFFICAHISNYIGVHALCKMRQVPASVTFKLTEIGLVFHLHAHDHLNMIITTLLYVLCEGW